LVSTAWLAENLDKVQVVEVRAGARSFSTQPVFETDPNTGKKSWTIWGGTSQVRDWWKAKNSGRSAVWRIDGEVHDS